MSDEFMTEAQSATAARVPALGFDSDRDPRGLAVQHRLLRQIAGANIPTRNVTSSRSCQRDTRHRIRYQCGDHDEAPPLRQPARADAEREHCAATAQASRVSVGIKPGHAGTRAPLQTWARS